MPYIQHSVLFLNSTTPSAQSGWNYNHLRKLSFRVSEKAMATHSSTLAWKIPWMEEAGGLPSMGSHRVGHDWSDLAAAAAAAAPYWQRRQWQPTPVLLLEKSHGRRSLVSFSPWGLKESDTTERLHFHFSLLCIGEGNGSPLQCSCPENPRDGGARWAAIYGVSQSWTGLKRLSSRALLRRDLAVPDVWRVSHWACAPSRGYSQPVTLCIALRLLIAIFTALLPVGMWAPLPDHWVFCCRSGSLDEIWEFLYFYWF